MKGNSLPIGTYSISITASAPGRNPSTGTFELNVVQNPYYFTYFSYGNNLDLSEEQTNYVSQFRVANKATLAALAPEIKYTDLPEAGKEYVTFTSESKMNLSTAQIDSKTGKLTFTDKSFANYQNGILFVTATTVDPEDSNKPNSQAHKPK